MKAIHILATAATLLVTATAPSFAAQRAYQSSDAHGAYARDVSSDRSGSYYYGPNARTAAPSATFGPSYGAQGFGGPGYIRPSQNGPYPYRPYGDPDRW
ncbi:MAG: hypothetical protein WCG92_10090 [Hyphomicrobiales bacterium]